MAWYTTKFKKYNTYSLFNIQDNGNIIINFSNLEYCFNRNGTMTSHNVSFAKDEIKNLVTYILSNLENNCNDAESVSIIVEMPKFIHVDKRLNPNLSHNDTVMLDSNEAEIIINLMLNLKSLKEITIKEQINLLSEEFTRVLSVHKNTLESITLDGVLSRVIPHPVNLQNNNLQFCLKKLTLINNTLPDSFHEMSDIKYFKLYQSLVEQFKVQDLDISNNVINQSALNKIIRELSNCVDLMRLNISGITFQNFAEHKKIISFEEFKGSIMKYLDRPGREIMFSVNDNITCYQHREDLFCMLKHLNKADDTGIIDVFTEEKKEEFIILT